MKHTYLSLALAAAVSPVLADEADIERIVVTSDFRQATLDQLSASASILDDIRLQSRQAEHLDSILSIAPNVNFASGASRGRFVQIRGIGERSQFAEPINPSVSLFVDDFDFSGLGASGLLFDTQQVEVFRGPQATLFGTGALAGAVKIASNGLSDEANGYAEVRVATQDSYRLEAAHGNALSDSVNYRAAFVHNKSDGFIENTFLGRDDTSNIDETAAKLALGIAVSDSSDLTLNYRWYDIDNGYDDFSLDNNRQTLSDEPGFDRQETHAFGLNSKTQFESGLLTLVATHMTHDIGYAYDEDWTFTGFHPFGYTSFDAYYRDVDTDMAEIRFASSEAASLLNGAMSWVVGAHYKSTDEELLRQYTFADGDFASTFSPTAISAYVEMTTLLNDNLSLVAGVRVENYDFDYQDNTGLTQSNDETMVGGKLSLNYIVDDQFFYASVSRGYKGPGFNPDERVSAEKRFFDAEFAWNYEVGYKGQLFHPSLTSRIAIFYMDRKNTQISDFDVLVRDDGTPDFIDVIDNADLGTNKGFEAELAWQATDSWRVNLNVGYLDATVEGYERADGTVVEEQNQAQSPNYTVNLFSELILSDSWLWRVDLDVKDEHRFSDGHDELSPFTALVNSQLVWSTGQWEASVWVKNALDREYYVRGFGGFSNDPRDEYAFVEPYFQLGAERQFGLTLSYQY